MNTLLKLVLLSIAATGAPPPWTKGAGAQGASPIRCEISMAAWCIATFDGVVSLTNAGDERVWRLQARGADLETAMTISESEGCSDSANESISLISTETEIGTEGATSDSIVYRLNDNGCTLRFHIPRSAKSGVYKRVMLYGILVGYKKAVQLYNVR
jgi:hypothetical protein